MWSYESDLSYNPIILTILSFPFLCSGLRFMYRVKVGENLFAEASAPNKKAARQLAAEEAVKELMADGKLQLNKVFNEKPRIDGDCIFLKLKG